MNIGEEIETLIIEPVEEPQREVTPQPEPQREKELVPA